MASIPSIPSVLDSIYTTSTTLSHFTFHTSSWNLLSTCLSDLREGLDAAELSLQSWQRKYDIHDRRPVIYLHVLFGKDGWERIVRALEDVYLASKRVADEVDGVVRCALRARPRGTTPQHSATRYDRDLVLASLHRLLKNPSWSRKFAYSALAKTSDLEFQLLRLHRKLGMLERLSDLYLEREHPDLFASIGTRLSGRRTLDSRQDDDVQHKLLAAVSARKDAELLHRASVSSTLNQEPREGETESEMEVQAVHIGLCVPQIHRRDFAFLLSLPGGLTQEILTHPVRIKAVNDRSRVQSSIPAALPSLLQNTNIALETDIGMGMGGREGTYLLPSATTTSGFLLSLPPTTLLTPLSFKDPLSTIVADHIARTPVLSQQILYPQDQVALACGIAGGCFRLIGTSWLDCLESGNVRWRRGAEGRWTAMMAALPGNVGIRRALGEWGGNGIGRGGEERKCRQVFRLGLLITEIALEMPVSCVEIEAEAAGSQVGNIKVYIEGMGEEGRPVDAVEIAAEVERRTNVLIGNMVFSCLSVLQDENWLGHSDNDVDKRFYRDVLGAEEELEGLVRRDARRAWGSAVGTPRSGRNAKGSVVY
ncbi:hypothetical protein K505DRAFT_321088 [Melanomma pulvis-pyrius CBS 109.77]|uniref:Uncharacterized protein n=1 Tax=Melanomma pulvis-pyrius CBS 109.77 TaxID=1314802 RepID=A0A6A6XSQ5_9PLEO|nr:hypothetical protein K505DRAFT_321088 [Melanomma pulvis-pyrius CBS 109.77]